MHGTAALELIISEIRTMAQEGRAPRELHNTHIDAQTAISDLGIDSLGKFFLLSAVEDRADVTLGEGDLSGLRTLGDLAMVLETAFNGLQGAGFERRAK